MTTEATQFIEEPIVDQSTRRGNNWRTLLLLFVLAGVVESQAFGHLGAFTPLFLQELHIPQHDVPTWTGILSALGFVLGLPLLPFWGVWADRFGRKLIIVRSAYIEGVLFTLAALSPSVWFLAVARFLTGFVLGNTGVMLAMLADATPRKRLGLAVGIASAGFPLGASIGPFFGGMIVQHYNIRTLLGVDAALSALIGLLLTLIIRRERRARSGDSTGRLLRTAVRDVVTSPGIARLFVLLFAAMYGIMLVSPFVPIRLQQLYAGDRRLLPALIGATLTGAGIAMAITTPLWGRLGDLFGRARVLPICLTAVSLGLLVEWAAPTLLPFQVAVVALGLFQGGIGTTILALLAVVAPLERRASILTFSLLPSQLSWFLGPLTGAFLARVTLQLPFLVGTIVVGVALMLTLLTLRRIGWVERAGQDSAT
jgi:MFS family permease